MAEWQNIRTVETEQPEQPARMTRTLERCGAAEGSGHHGLDADGPFVRREELSIYKELS